MDVTTAGAAVGWHTYPDIVSPAAIAASTWVLDSEGYLEVAAPLDGASSVLAAYIDAASTRASIQVSLAPKANVEAAVAAGTIIRVKGCVDPQTSALSLSVGGGRNGLYQCGFRMWFSTGDDPFLSNCSLLTPTAA
jgi:hypothetical protein